MVISSDEQGFLQVDCSDSHLIEQRMERMFTAVCCQLGYTTPHHMAFVEIVPMVMSHQGSHDELVPTDNKITTLYIKSVPVAIVVEHRTELNYVFASFMLMPMLNDVDITTFLQFQPETNT